MSMYNENVYWKRMIRTSVVTMQKVLYISQKNFKSVSQLRIFKAALIGYFGRRSECGNVSPNENLNIKRDMVTNLTRQETPDVFDLA